MATHPSGFDPGRPLKPCHAYFVVEQAIADPSWFHQTAPTAVLRVVVVGGDNVVSTWFMDEDTALRVLAEVRSLKTIRRAVGAPFESPRPVD